VIERVLDILVIIIYLLIMTVPAFLLALVDTPAGRIGIVFW